MGFLKDIVGKVFDSKVAPVKKILDAAAAKGSKASAELSAALPVIKQDLQANAAKNLVKGVAMGATLAVGGAALLGKAGVGTVVAAKGVTAASVTKGAAVIGAGGAVKLGGAGGPGGGPPKIPSSLPVPTANVVHDAKGVLNVFTPVPPGAPPPGGVLNTFGDALKKGAQAALGYVGSQVSGALGTQSNTGSGPSGPQGTMTVPPSSSMQVPVWVWPLAALAALFLFRKK